MNRTISCYNATVAAATVQRFFSTEKRRFRFCAILLPSSALNLAQPPNTTQPPLSSIFKKEVAVLRRGSEIPRSPTLLRCHHESKLLSLVKNGGTFCSLVFNFITLANFKLKPADCLPIFTAFFFSLASIFTLHLPTLCALRWRSRCQEKVRIFFTVIFSPELPASEFLVPISKIYVIFRSR